MVKKKKSEDELPWLPNPARFKKPGARDYSRLRVVYPVPEEGRDPNVGIPQPKLKKIRHPKHFRKRPQFAKKKGWKLLPQGHEPNEQPIDVLDMKPTLAYKNGDHVMNLYAEGEDEEVWRIHDQDTGVSLQIYDMLEDPSYADELHKAIKEIAWSHALIHSTRWHRFEKVPRA